MFRGFFRTEFFYNRTLYAERFGSNFADTYRGLLPIVLPTSDGYFGSGGDGGSSSSSSNSSREGNSFLA